MYCNQIFSILKKVEPITETPVEDIPVESTSEENSEVSSSEELSESEILSESESASESESVSEEISESESLVSESEDPIEENLESESPVEPEEEITEDPEEEPIEESPLYVIANVIVCASYEIASKIARCEFGESALAIDTTLYPVAIGDFYKDGVFYDPFGIEIKRNPTESEQIEALTLANMEQKEIIELQAEEIALLNETLLEMLMG